MVCTTVEPTAPTASPPVSLQLRVLPPDTSAKQEFNGEVPSEFICPITNKIMQDPVTAADGCVYERQAIRRWLRKKRTSPMTNEELTDLTLRPNDELRDRIVAFKGEHSLV